jgi:hypothetical protein
MTMPFSYETAIARRDIIARTLEYIGENTFEDEFEFNSLILFLETSLSIANKVIVHSTLH